MRIIKRICALLACGAMGLCMVKSVPAERVRAEGKLEVGYWSLKEKKVIYAGLIRARTDDEYITTYDTPDGIFEVPIRDDPNEIDYYVKNRVYEANHVANSEPYDQTDYHHGEYLGGTSYETTWTKYIQYIDADISWDDPPSVIHVYSTNGPDTTEYSDIEISAPMPVRFNVGRFLDDIWVGHSSEWSDSLNRFYTVYTKHKEDDPWYVPAYGKFSLDYSEVEKGTVIDEAFAEEVEPWDHGYYDSYYTYNMPVYDEEFSYARNCYYGIVSYGVDRDVKLPDGATNVPLDAKYVMGGEMAEPFLWSNKDNMFTGNKMVYENNTDLVLWACAEVYDAEVVQAYVYEYTPLVEGGKKTGAVAPTDSDSDTDSKIYQEVTSEAESEDGEDEGTTIISDIINGIDKDDAKKAGGAGVAALGAAALANKGKGKDGKKKDKKKKSSYKMYVWKDFGDTLEKGKVYKVCSRIVEVLETGEEKTRNDLTSKIVPFSADNSLTVTDGGMVRAIYKSAAVSIPDGCTVKEGMVSFQYTGEGGTFTKNVIFKLEAPEILFGQENLGLPAYYEKETELWFGVKGMTEPIVTAEFTNKKCPYKITLKRDEKIANLWCAIIVDTEKKPVDEPVKEGEKGKDKPQPGDTRRYSLHITATEKPKSGIAPEKTEGYFDVLRIQMGLSLKFEQNALGCYNRLRDNAPKNVSDDDYVPCVTKGRMVLLYWNEEEKKVDRVAAITDSRTPLEIKAVKVENAKNVLIGEANESHQRMVEGLGICLFSTKDLDSDGSRIVELCCTKALLDPPNRLRAEVTVEVRYKGEVYSCKKKLLLHSLPMRDRSNEYAYSEMLKNDDRLTEKLTIIKGQILSAYMNNLFSLYYFIDRMIDGYDPNFGYDEDQVKKVYEVWINFVRGNIVGANAKAEKVTLADELNACYAFMQGMRDNGGFLGRMALGIATGGVSETIFFGMELAEKMEDIIVNQGKDMDFWDGVKLGAQEYAKQALTDALIGGALKTANFVGSEILTAHKAVKAGKSVPRIDIATEISKKYRSVMDAADNALKSKSTTYKGVSGSLERIGIFSSSGASSMSEINAQNEKLDAQASADVKRSIAQRRSGEGWTPEQLKRMQIEDEAMAEGMKKVKRLYELQKKHGTARKEGTLLDVEAEYEEAWLDVKTDKNAFKLLKRMNDPYAQTVRADFTRVRKRHRQVILDRVLDDVAEMTGKNRADLYYQSVTSHEAWKEDAGLSMSEDLDLTIRERCWSNDNMDLDPVIDQGIGDRAVQKNLYKEFHGGDAPPSDKAAQLFAEDMDVTYVEPYHHPNGYTIVPNPEAFLELKPLFEKKFFSDELRVKAMDRYTIAHKGKEWNKRGQRFDARAAELEAKAAILTGAQREAMLQEAKRLQYKAVGCYVEGIRQITKEARGVIQPRGKWHQLKTGIDPFTRDARRMTAAGEMVNEGMGPSRFLDYIDSEFGMDFNAYADSVAGCLE